MLGKKMDTHLTRLVPEFYKIESLNSVDVVPSILYEEELVAISSTQLSLTTEQLELALQGNDIETNTHKVIPSYRETYLRR